MPSSSTRKQARHVPSSSSRTCRWKWSTFLNQKGRGKGRKRHRPCNRESRGRCYTWHYSCPQRARRRAATAALEAAAPGRGRRVGSSGAAVLSPPEFPDTAAWSVARAAAVGPHACEAAVCAAGGTGAVGQSASWAVAGYPRTGGVKRQTSRRVVAQPNGAREVGEERREATRRISN
jgi:hypothetical protein